MIRSYLKIAVRHLKKGGVYSIVNVCSLALGLAVFMLGALYINFILRFDTFHQNGDRIYGVVQVFPSSNKGEQHSAITSPPLARTMADDFPEIEDATRFFPAGEMKMEYRDHTFLESGILFVDPNFLDFFTFRLMEGNPKTALAEPNAMILSESAAFKYFGDDDPIDKFIALDENIRVRITGVVEDVPSNSSIRYDFLASMKTAENLYPGMSDWSVSRIASFIRLPTGYDASRMDEKLSAFVEKYLAGTPDSPNRIYLFPLLDFHLKSEGIASYLVSNPPGELYSSLAGVTVFLLIVCLNFVNLTTARHMTRAREVGLRKVVGARRPQLMKQFLGESILLSFFALPLAVVMFEYICPKFLAYFGNAYDISLWKESFPLLFFLGVTVMVGIAAGSYPAFLLSSFRPASVLKGRVSFDSKRAFARKGLVVSQFVLSIIFIIFTIGLRNQFGFLLKYDLGYDREDVLVAPMTETVRSDFEAMRKEIMRHPGIRSVSAAAHFPFRWENESRVVPEGYGDEEPWAMHGYGMDRYFIETLGMQVVLGQNFSEESPQRDYFILNETAVHRLQWADPIGRHIAVGDREGTIIGIVKDFHFRMLSRPMAPTVLFQAPEEHEYIFIKTASGQDSDVLAYIEQTWHTFAPDQPLVLSWLDHKFEEAYGDISKSATIGEIVGGFAVILSCLGLLGLANFTVRRRTKEIGIRKVVGATSPGIFRMLIREFLFMLIVANSVAWPLSYFTLKSMLQSSYAYPVDMDIGYFLLATVLTLSSAVLTVLSQTVKAARANPVDSLRYE